MLDSGTEITLEDRRLAAQVLNQVLADCTVLAIRTRLCIWNMPEPAASLMSDALQQQCLRLAGLGERVARRVRSLGFQPPRTTRELLDLSPSLRREASPRSPRDMLTRLADHYHLAAGSVRFARPIAADLDDGATLGLLDQALQEHEEMASRLREFGARADSVRELLDAALDEEDAAPIDG